MKIKALRAASGRSRQAGGGAEREVDKEHFHCKDCSICRSPPLVHHHLLPFLPRSTRTFAASLPILSGPRSDRAPAPYCLSPPSFVAAAAAPSAPRFGRGAAHQTAPTRRHASTHVGKLVSPERRAAESRTSRQRAEDPGWSSSLSELLMLDPRSEVYPTIEYRPIQPSDLEVLENIHLALFPIRYEREFFLNVVNGHGIVSWGAVDTSRSDDRRDELIGFVTTRVIPAQDCELRQGRELSSQQLPLCVVRASLVLAAEAGKRGSHSNKREVAQQLGRPEGRRAVGASGASGQQWELLAHGCTSS
ncbi:hypothetical protein ABZP36_031433 [Zizania latifolia]